MVFEKSAPSELTALSGELVRRMNENSRRLRIMEQRLDKIESSLSMLEQSAINQMNDMKINLDKISMKITTVTEKFKKIEEDIISINKELGKTATKAEVKQLETFIDLVNPITSKFITKDQLERALEDRMARKA